MSVEPTLAQCDVMRVLYSAHRGDKGAVIRAYAAAELAGHVHRVGKHLTWNGEKYAADLWRDGMKNGWLV